MSPDKGGRKIVYLDCYSGLSGDMFLGALVDCGVDPVELERLLAGLNLPGWRLQVEKVIRHGLSGTDLTVQVEQPGRRYRHLPEITGLIRESSLPETVKEKSIAVFTNLAEAEAAVHGIPREEVHFHEVGALDAVIDIVGCVTALYLLGISAVYCSPLPAGRGMTRSAHGLIPLPAPAVLELLRRRRIPLYGKDSELELVTPTGAALAATLADSFGPLPPLVVEAVGYGAGKKDPGYPNYLRVLLGEPVADPAPCEERFYLVEANIDDLNPEVYGYLMEILLERGAADVYFTAVQMKKNRPAVKLSILASAGALDRLVETVFYETSTLGVRIMEGRKVMRPRAVEPVETEWGLVRVKLVPAPGGAAPLHYAPEYEDCLAVARKSGLPLKEVYRLVESLFRGRKN